MSEQPQTMPQPVTLGARQWAVVGLSLLVVLFFLLSPTTFVLGKLDTVAYAVCHRIAERSFFLGGHQLPLCARCSGTFLGILLTLVTLTLAGRSRASRLPPPRVLVVLAGFVLLWAFDGVNSYLTLFPGAPHLYEPQNWLRLTTGTLNGLALGALIFAIFNFSLWRAPPSQAHSQQVIKGWGELMGLVALAVLLIGLVLTRDHHLLYPLALASTLGVVVTLTSVNTIVVLIAIRRENIALRWRDAALPLLVALALSLGIIMGIGAGRAALTDALHLPF
jgi:uncharacterized membrane protein